MGVGYEKWRNVHKTNTGSAAGDYADMVLDGEELLDLEPLSVSHLDESKCGFVAVEVLWLINAKATPWWIDRS